MGSSSFPPSVRLVTFSSEEKKTPPRREFSEILLAPSCQLLFSHSSSHPPDFLSFLQKIFTAIFLLLLPALFASCWAESDHRKNRTSSSACSWAARTAGYFPNLTGGGFLLSSVSLHSRKLFTCRNSTALFQLANSFSFLVGVGFLIF